MTFITVIGSFMQANCRQAEHQPKPDETRAATGLRDEPAGKGLAVAVGCRRLGADVDLLLALGDDEAGHALMQRLPRDFGLHARHVRQYAGASGSGAGANARLDAAHVAQAGRALAHAALVYAQFEAPPQAALEAFSRAREGACTVLNPSPWQPLAPELLACTQVLLVNAAEAAQLLPGWPPDLQPAQRAALAAMLRPWWRTWPGESERALVVTLGAGGALAFTPDGESHWTPALHVPVQDSAGAGDAFASGLCIALAHRKPLHQALGLGSACGAFAVTRDGVLDGLPTWAELQAFVKTAAAAPAATKNMA